MYEIIVVPALTPVTTFVAEIIEAIVESLLSHLPRVVASLNVIVAPVQTLVGPEIAPGGALTVTTVVVVQPPGRV